MKNFHLQLHLRPQIVQLTSQLKPVKGSFTMPYLSQWGAQPTRSRWRFFEQIFLQRRGIFPSLDEYVNVQNMLRLRLREFSSNYITLRCSLWLEGVIGLYFYENDNDETVTINSHDYDGRKKTDFFLPTTEEQTIYGFNSMMPLDIQHGQMWLNWGRYFPASWWCQLATEIARFDAVGLYLVGLRERLCLHGET